MLRRICNINPALKAAHSFSILIFEQNGKSDKRKEERLWANMTYLRSHGESILISVLCSLANIRLSEVIKRTGFQSNIIF